MIANRHPHAGRELPGFEQRGADFAIREAKHLHFHRGARTGVRFELIQHAPGTRGILMHHELPYSVQQANGKQAVGLLVARAAG